MKAFRFGFLNCEQGYDFEGGHICPVDAFSDAKRWIEAYAHKDGFLYPPVTTTRDEHSKVRPNTERPAHLHRVPASHVLVLDNVPPTDDLGHENASVIMHLVGYLHGALLQFEDWWADTRVPLGRRAIARRPVAEDFISLAYTRWKTWSPANQTRFTNILFMFNRAPSYEWDWEHFILEYILLDSCYKLGLELKLFGKAPGHGERARLICDAFGLARNDDLVREIVRLRNDLFHEALWDRCRPGTATSGASFYAPRQLHKLNQRIILAIAGYHNGYMRSPWWTLGSHSFGPP